MSTGWPGGPGERGEEPYAELAEADRQARTQVRVEAERWVLAHQPLAWLRLGPGRNRWAQPVAPGSDEEPEMLIEALGPAEVEALAAGCGRRTGRLMSPAVTPL